ncbi:U2 snRNP-associated protein Sap145 [Schizosaccharomyces japonicus yFS275]|uniref:U2 snRNP-associated protein Sap145 n=1 Tax=Schizosaccharomyces japonicus (strain yFS275 / FY16936) TaxID=402676 RepID=B6JVB5_SCHJY|nr:U2 snRNP-associated protein Sap145 [Schizosaccharomyces japonicus yFS275]EEB05316.1 U2 snRNP-associated protein Sap145 [Schizosaccharomyces japonicus yFS275]
MSSAVTDSAPVADNLITMSGVQNTTKKKPDKKSRNQIRREKKKLKRLQVKKEQDTGAAQTLTDHHAKDKSLVKKEEPEDSIYDTPVVVESITIESDDPLYSQFQHILEKFRVEETEDATGEYGRGQIMFSDEEELSEGENAEGEGDHADGNHTLSKKKARRLRRKTVAQLKMLAEHPEVVEWWDVSSPDPLLLVHLKGYRCTIPVPQHWNQKRDYLSGQRGVEKKLFELPSYIRATGIMQMREAVHQKEADMSLRQKMREKVQPKMGKLDIDYQKLHDAFFRFQTKPIMTGFGECYYEGKELEANIKEKRPGDISEELRDALGIAVGAPPPWLFAMQRYGPPPSYPNLKIPGVNCPIPEGAQWGFHPGGWGKPPVDQFNRPLYGDVFGNAKPRMPEMEAEPVNRQRWGELEEFEEEESSSDEEEEEEEPEEDMGHPEMEEHAHIQHTTHEPSRPAAATVEPITSYGIAEDLAPENMELRKNARPKSSTSDEKLYHVLPEKATRPEGFMAQQTRYETPSTSADYDQQGRKRKAEDVPITTKLNNSEDARSRNPGSDWQNDLSEMVAEQVQKVSAKRQRPAPTKKEKFRL